MRKRNTNRIRMIGATISYCENNSSAWASIPAFAGDLNEVKAKKQEIDKLNEDAMGATTGVTQDTRALKRKMAEKAVLCGGRIQAFAHRNRNNTLAYAVKFTLTQLMKMSKNNAMAQCRNIRDAAANNIGALGGYGITMTEVNELTAAIDAYEAACQNPRAAIVKRSGANRRIKALVREIIDKLLVERLDCMVDTLMMSQPAFWGGYQQAREILDLGIVHTKVKGQVLDVNDVPVGGVHFTVREAGTQQVIREAVSEQNGKFAVMRMAVGNFDFRWELNGSLIKEEKNVRVAAGKVVRRRVRV